MESISAEQRNLLSIILKKSGLALMEDKKSMLIEKIKNSIVELVHYSEEQQQINLSDYLIEKLNYDYSYLANLFSGTQGTTIEKFYLAHRIERIKELLVYGNLSVTEIADKLKYSSVAHFSNQFKKMTGLTPSHFKNLKHKKHKPPENV